jgi:hypothetical protein
MSEYAENVSAPVRTTASGEPPLSISAMPPTLASAA